MLSSNILWLDQYQRQGSKKPSTKFKKKVMTKNEIANKVMDIAMETHKEL